MSPAARYSLRFRSTTSRFFGLPPKLNIDVPALEKRFLRTKPQLHPDLNARAGSQEQEWSLEQSSLLNDAYRTLKDPIKRTQYLLHLEGVELEEQSKSATEQARVTGELKKQIVPPDLLEEVFELNMQLEELRMNKKMGDDDPDLVAEIGKAKAGPRSQACVLAAGIAILLERLGQPGRSQARRSSDERAQATSKMVDVLNRRNYIRNLVRDVNEALEE